VKGASKVTAELNIHLEDPVSAKTVRQDLHKSNIHARAEVVKPLITENNAKRRRRLCDYNKIWASNEWKYVILSDELSSFTLSPNSGRVYV
jgi:hypothetical protein